MNTPIDSKRSAQQVRVRLLYLLLRAYAVAILLIVLLLLAYFVIFITQSATTNPVFRPRLSSTLETYFMINGNWNNVQSIFDQSNEAVSDSVLEEWYGSVLMDPQGNIVMDHGVPPSQPTIYASRDPAHFSIQLKYKGQNIGTLVMDNVRETTPWKLMLGMAAPLGVISILLGLMTFSIGSLLMRRVADPLADVITAAQRVSRGDLKTRVKVQGPDDLRALSDSFNLMASTLDENDRQKRDMFVDIAHELRTPLTIMRGRLEGIVDGIYPMDEAHVALILEETYLLERIVDDLRVLALAESQRLQFNLEPVDLNALAHQVVSFYEAEAVESKIRLTVEVDETLPQIYADPQRVMQVIGNLVSNALRYVPSGGDVLVQTGAVPEGAWLTVKDTGPGIPEADLPHAFDRFWRGEKSRSRATGGAGLGLSIARQLIEGQNGKISLRNGQEAGLEVSFILPFDKGPKEV